MTQLQTTDKSAPAPRKRRISPKVREALRIKVEEGKPWKECAQRAGMSEAGIHKARLAPHVQQLFEDMKAQYVQRIEGMEKIHKARALEVARELLEQTDNKQVRARMVEFLRRDPPSPAVAVQINTNAGGDYEYPKPGSLVVKIVDPTDATSEGQDEESQQ